MTLRTRPVLRRGSPLRASLVALLLLAACQPAAEDPDSGSEAEGASPSEVTESRGRAPTGTATPGAVQLPGLLAVMSGLEQDMARLSRGIWRADYDSIAVAARDIAAHPKVPPSEAQQIAAILGPVMAAFKGVDTEIHDVAVRIDELATEEDLDAIMRAEGDLRAGCVACHTRFRDRIRDALP